MHTLAFYTMISTHTHTYTRKYICVVSIALALVHAPHASLCIAHLSGFFLILLIEFLKHSYTQSHSLSHIIFALIQWHYCHTVRVCVCISYNTIFTHLMHNRNIDNFFFFFDIWFSPPPHYLSAAIFHKPEEQIKWRLNSSLSCEGLFSIDKYLVDTK